jgi:hypothetical protein
VFADGLGHARHLAVAPDGVVYVNTWSGRYYGNDTPPAGGFLVALKDTNGSGRADVIARFGESVQTGAPEEPASDSIATGSLKIAWSSWCSIAAWSSSGDGE